MLIPLTVYNVEIQPNYRHLFTLVAFCCKAISSKTFLKLKEMTNLEGSNYYCRQ